MAIGLVFLAAIPAYLAAAVALFLGSGWLMAFGILVGTGVVGTLALGAMRVAMANGPAQAGSLSLT